MSGRHNDNGFSQDDRLYDESDPFSFKVVNIVATVITEIDKVIDLNQIIQKCEDVEYHPERFPGLIMRIKNPHATLLIFSSGRMVVTGLRKIIHAPKVVQKAIKKIQKAGFKLRNPKIIIQNIVATGDLHLKIDLDKATIVADNIMYEPEVFPGMIYRIPDPKTVFIIFSTGKIVCLGAKEIETIEIAIKELHKQIHEYDVIQEELELGEYETITFL